MEWRGQNIEIETICRLIGSFGFPLVLSVYLIIELNGFFKKIAKNNEDLAFIIANEVKEMTKAVIDLRLELCKK
jgi:hypothetical protein